jgi:tetratricopeptide (TPR) repeat protein
MAMKKYCLLLLLLLLCGVVPAQNERIRQLDKEALELYRQEKFQEALVKYDQLLELVKDNYKLYYLRSYCNLMLKRYDASMADLNMSLKYNTSRDVFFSDAHKSLAYISYLKGDKEAAFDHYATSETQKDNNGNPLYLDADTLYKQQKYDEAMAVYQQCIDHNIALFRSNYFMALIQYHRSMYKEAGPLFKKAAEYKTDKDWPRAMMMYGVCEARLKRYQSSFKALDACIGAGFSEALAYYYRGLVQLKSRLSRYTWESLNDFKKVLALNPTSLEGAYGVALFRVVSRQYDAGITLLDSLIKAYPREPNLYVALGQAYVGLNQPSQALVAFNQAKRIDANLTDAYLESAKLYLEQQQPEFAMTELTLAKQLAPNDYELSLYEARAISMMGRYDEAEQLLKKLTYLTYDDLCQYQQRWAGFFLGMQYLEQNKIEKGKDQLIFATLDDEAGLYYGDWWLKQGDIEKAYNVFSETFHNGDFGSIELQTRVAALTLAKKKYRDAWSYYRDAIKMDPLSAEAHLGFGLACVGIKHYPDAINALTKAIELYHTVVIPKPINPNVYLSIFDVPGVTLKQLNLPRFNLQEAHYQRALLYLKQKNSEDAKRDLEAAANLGHEAARKRFAKL